MAKTNALVGTVLSIALVAGWTIPGCSADEATDRLVVHEDERKTAAASDDASPSELKPEPTEVAGRLSVAKAGRAITIVDARGRAQRSSSDDAGIFRIREVVPPYDLAVSGSSGQPTTMYLGIRRSDPFVELFDDSGIDSPPSRTVRATVRLGQSPCAKSSGWITVTTSSLSGDGTSLVRCKAGDKRKTLAVEHVARLAPIAQGEAITVHVLVENDEASAFAYGSQPVFVADAGDAGEAASIEPAAVGIGSPVRVTARGEATLLADWQWVTALWLDVGGDGMGSGSPIFSAASAGTSESIALPVIPGSTLRASVFGRHPKDDEQTLFFRSTESWSGVRSPTAGAIDLDVIVGLDVVRPKEAASLSRSALSFEWSGGVGTTIAILSVFDAENAPVLRVVTTEQALLHERSRALGLDLFPVGDYRLELAAWTDRDVDGMTSPDAPTRTARFDRTGHGRTTLLRIPFVVVD